MEVAIGSLVMRNPIMLASGTVGYGYEYEGLIDFGSVGAVVTKTINLEPRRGNAPPRLVETEGGLLNSIGLENVGLAAFLTEKLPKAAALPTAIVASIAGESEDEFAELSAALGTDARIAAIEINISCPNVKRRERPLWDDPEGAAATTAAARRRTTLPLLVKLSPNTASSAAMAAAVERAGADAVVVANTLPAMRIDIENKRPALANVTGGLSGAALMPVNLALTWIVSGAVSIPVIGCGGVRSPGDALEYIMAGATAVQVGTAVFSDPLAPAAIAEGLSEFAASETDGSISGLIGLARKETRQCLRAKRAD